MSIRDMIGVALALLMFGCGVWAVKGPAEFASFFLGRVRAADPNDDEVQGMVRWAGCGIIFVSVLILVGITAG